MACTTARTAVVRGRPPGVAAGMSGAKTVHAIAVRFVVSRCTMACPPQQVPRGPPSYHAEHFSDRLCTCAPHLCCAVQAHVTGLYSPFTGGNVGLERGVLQP